MADHRFIRTKTWNDGWFHLLSPDAKLLFLYLITNLNTSLSGFYESHIDTFVVDTGLTAKRAKDALKELKGKIDYIDGWVCIKNYAFHQNASNSPKIQSLIERDLKRVPDHIQKKANEIFASSIQSQTSLQSQSQSEGIDRVSIEYTENEKDVEKTKDLQYGETGAVSLSADEYQKLCELFGERNTNVLIEELDDYIGMKGNKYKSHYKALRSWGNRKIQEYKLKMSTTNRVKKEMV